MKKMKKMKKIKVVFITLAVITLSFITESYLYTKEKVYELGKDLGADNFWRNNFYDSSDPYSNPDLNLGTLLSINFRRLDEFIIRDEDYKIKNNKWKDLIASNPSLAYTAFDLYSSSFIEGYKSSFEESKKERLKEMGNDYTDGCAVCVTEVSRINALNSSSSLKSDFNSMKKYDKLIGELLKLDDATLNRYIKSASKDPSCFWSETEEPVEALELRKWLKKNYIAENLYYAGFPGDLIALTNRVSTNYPKWTNRKFLLEAQKFSLHVQKNLKY
jgi:hypothetical protein